jgi:phytol kinase
MPIAAVWAFLALGRIAPCRSPYPDLDFIAATAGVAAFWLFAGELTGHNAINLYNLTFAGVATVFVVLATGRHRLGGAALILTLVIGVLVIAPLNIAAACWMGPFALWVVTSLGLCAVAAWARPDLFERYRSPRAFAVAMVAPIILFAAKSIAS